MGWESALILSAPLSAHHMLSASVTRSLFLTSLPSFLPCDSFSIYVFLFFCLSQPLVTPVSHSFFFLLFSLFLLLSLSPSPPHTCGCDWLTDEWLELPLCDVCLRAAVDQSLTQNKLLLLTRKTAQFEPRTRGPKCVACPSCLTGKYVQREKAGMASLTPVFRCITYLITTN